MPICSRNNSSIQEQVKLKQKAKRQSSTTGDSVVRRSIVASQTNEARDSQTARTRRSKSTSNQSGSHEAGADLENAPPVGSNDAGSLRTVERMLIAMERHPFT